MEDEHHKDTSLNLILLSFKILPLEYRDKIRILSALREESIDHTYFTLIRKCVEVIWWKPGKTIDTGQNRKGEAKYKTMADMTEYLDKLWKVFRVYALDKRRFGFFVRHHLEPEINKAFTDYHFSRLSEAALDSLIEMDRETRIGLFSTPTDVVKTVIAGEIYKPTHFRKVDSLVKGGKRQAAALDLVCRENNFNREGFEKMYRKRWLKRGKSSLKK